MCGIVGAYSFGSGSFDYEKIVAATKRLLHRGPDYHNVKVLGKACFGHTRLSIIDPSPLANQPFEKNGLLITFNGEIYNYKELKQLLEKKGATFVTHSDTEVIIESYKQWGVSCVNKFVGMWAFGLYDKKTDVFLLSRDRIGEKPLVYYHDKNNNSLLFASELPALLVLMDKKQIQPDWKVISNFNTYNFQHIPTPRTAFKNIFKLKPGCSLLIKKGRVCVEKYFYLEKKPIKDIFKETDDILKLACEYTSVSDVPIGIFLSGGVDSSLICEYLKKQKLSTYTIGKNSKDQEVRRAKVLAKKLNLKNNITYFDDVLPKELLDKTIEVISLLGEPILLFQIVYSDILLQEMKKDGIKVAIGGNGADELYYGYDGSQKQLLLSLLHQLVGILKLRRLFSKIPFFYGVLGVEPTKVKTIVYKNKIKEKKHLKKEFQSFLYSKELEEAAQEVPSKKLIDIMNWQGLRFENEHSVTMVSDISSSKNGMEIRTPFLTPYVISLAVNTPTKYKVKGLFQRKKNKFILRELLRKYHGKEFAYQDKIGFGKNIQPYQQFAKLPKEIEYYFSALKDIPIYDTEYVIKEKNKYIKGENADINAILEVLMVCIWYKEVFLTFKQSALSRIVD